MPDNVVRDPALASLFGAKIPDSGVTGSSPGHSGPKLKVKLLNLSAQAPKRGNEFAAGYDLFTDSQQVLEPGSIVKIPTGVAIEIPIGFVGLILDRSSMGIKSCKVFGGVIDSDYRGEINVLILNFSRTPITLDRGSKVAQLVITKHLDYSVEVVQELTPTDRGDKGFGQLTGK